MFRGRNCNWIAGRRDCNNRDSQDIKNAQRNVVGSSGGSVLRGGEARVWISRRVGEGRNGRAAAARWLDAELLAAHVNKHGAFVLGDAVLAGVQLSIANEMRDCAVVLVIVDELLEAVGLADVAQDGGEELSAVAVRQLV